MPVGRRCCERGCRNCRQRRSTTRVSTMPSAAARRMLRAKAGCARLIAMLLIGMFDSPFVRRVAVSLRLLGLPFEHAAWSIGRDFERIRAYNPLGRVPTLVLDDGEALLDSSVILDYLDERVGYERALLPRAG